MSLRVSVLIPTYNRAAYLPHTVEAVLSQTYPPAEVIVIDDGSTDDTESALASFRSRILYRRVENGRVCRARNIALSVATSPYLAFCDSDDLWRKDKLAQQMTLHEQNPRLDYSFTNFVFFPEDPKSTRTKFDDAPSGFFPADLPPGSAPVVLEHAIYDQLLTFQPIWPSTVVVARRLIEQIGGFEESLGRNPSEDFEFSLRCVQHAPIGIVREPVVSVRRHADNFSKENYANTLGQIEVLEYALQRHTLSNSIRSLVQEEIQRRRVEASYDAFLQAEFAQVNTLLAGVPSSYLNPKTKLKKMISRLPTPLARAAHKLLTDQR